MSKFYTARTSLSASALAKCVQPSHVDWHLILPTIWTRQDVPKGGWIYGCIAELLPL